MLANKRVVVVLPAYNAEQTLEATCREIPRDLVDAVILVDDASQDRTVPLARALGVDEVLVHACNAGYGANQKTCYDAALRLGADIVVMLHPDYQYTPKLIRPMAAIIAEGVYPVVLGSRILGNGALRGGMPRYKYVANRLLTLIQNLLLGEKLSEYHSGYRAFSRDVLVNVNYHANSDDFVFDNQMLAQVFMAGYPIAEVTCPTRYTPESSSIGFARSIRYGFGVLRTSLDYRLAKWGLARPAIFAPRPPEGAGRA